MYKTKQTIYIWYDKPLFIPQWGNFKNHSSGILYTCICMHTIYVYFFYIYICVYWYVYIYLYIYIYIRAVSVNALIYAINLAALTH